MKTFQKPDCNASVLFTKLRHQFIRRERSDLRYCIQLRMREKQRTGKCLMSFTSSLVTVAQLQALCFKSRKKQKIAKENYI